uniref:Uncharacterized protein n=1 Tax=Corvus moneduloides TaxID=1196302 RepID=A0A8C3DU32_CORMO
HQNPTTTKTTSRGTSESGAFPGNESRLLVAGQPWRVLDSTAASSQLPCGKLISPLLVFPGSFQPVLTPAVPPAPPSNL